MGTQRWDRTLLAWRGTTALKGGDMSVAEEGRVVGPRRRGGLGMAVWGWESQGSESTRVSGGAAKRQVENGVQTE